MIEDRLLIWRCKQGNKTAFKRIYEKYEGDLRTLAANLLEDKTAAEDVVHDVFISFLSIVDKFELRSNLAGYLAADDNGPVRLILQSELLQQVGSAMSRLPYEQREAIVLYLHGRMKFKAIGEFQKVSTKTAYKRYRAGLNKLKSLLNSEFEK
jgi:DNA-directed RNA polymerase specialized sigma24 family protein